MKQQNPRGLLVLSGAVTPQELSPDPSAEMKGRQDFINKYNNNTETQTRNREPNKQNREDENKEKQREHTEHMRTQRNTGRTQRNTEKHRENTEKQRTLRNVTELTEVRHRAEHSPEVRHRTYQGSSHTH